MATTKYMPVKHDITQHHLKGTAFVQATRTLTSSLQHQKNRAGPIRYDPLSTTEQAHPSDPRIVLLKLHPSPRFPELPIVTRVFQVPLPLLVQLDLRLVLQDLQCKPARSVPRDVAVHEPRPGVVRLECQHEVALRRQ